MRHADLEYGMTCALGFGSVGSEHNQLLYSHKPENALFKRVCRLIVLPSSVGERALDGRLLTLQQTGRIEILNVKCNTPTKIRTFKCKCNFPSGLDPIPLVRAASVSRF